MMVRRAWTRAAASWAMASCRSWKHPSSFRVLRMWQRTRGNITSYLATKQLVTRNVSLGKTTSSRNHSCIVTKNKYMVQTIRGCNMFRWENPHRRVTTCRGWLQPEHVNHSLQKRASARGHYEEITGGQRVRLWSWAKDNYSRGQGGAFIMRQVV